MNHAGKRLFITGIPTSGKSYLAKIVAKKTGGRSIILDDLRQELSADIHYKQWTDFYLNQDEKTYLSTTSNEKQWDDLVAQSEGLWPAFLKEIAKFKNETQPVIFECVNMLPHLVKRDLGFNGVVLIGTSFEETLERNKKDPRWGNTPELQELEAKAFFYVERPRYKEEALKFGYPTFEKADDAIEYCVNLLK